MRPVPVNLLTFLAFMVIMSVAVVLHETDTEWAKGTLFVLTVLEALALMVLLNRFLELREKHDELKRQPEKQPADEKDVEA